MLAALEATRLVGRSPELATASTDANAAIGAAHDEDEARRMFDAARSVGVPINVIDRPEHCTFQFGAIVNRSPLVVGISTDGAAPMFGQAIRSGKPCQPDFATAVELHRLIDTVWESSK